MDSISKIYLERAENEFLLSQNDFKISIDKNIKEALGIQANKTFFNSAINHAYYAIFYCAKAYLNEEGIKTSPPEEHKKTYEEFKKLVNSGRIKEQLLRIYETENSKAEVLLDILFTEKKKRGIFTYNIKSEANIPYATESIENARIFISAIKIILEKNTR